MEQFVIDNKRNKIIRFIYIVIIITFMCSLSFMRYDHKGALTFIGVGAVVGLIMAVASFVGTPTVQITVSDSTVTINKNKIEESYKISDYDGPVVTMEPSGKSTKPVGSLVFDSGYKNMVKCPEFSMDEFRRISDAIRVRQYKMVSDTPVEEGGFDGTYNGSYTPIDNRKFIIVVAVMAVLSLFACVFVSLLFKLSDTGRIYFRVLYSLVAIGSVICCVVMHIAGKKSQQMAVKDITVDQMLLNINEESYEISKIKSMYITKPCIKDILPAVRCMIFMYGDEKKPVKYMLEPRPDESIEDDGNYQRFYSYIISICMSRGIRILEDEPRALTYANPQAFRRRT